MTCSRPVYTRSHKTSTGDLPLVPGVDGVGRMPDGTLRYFALGDSTAGAMAEQTVIDLRQSFELPASADPVLVAAAMNPAMSAWVALRRRIDFRAGQTVLILGATGSSGQLAVQIAKRLGAGRVIAAGRDPQKLAALPALGADTVVRLGPDAAIPSAALRALPLQIVGSGQGSVSTADLLAELPALADEITSGALRLDDRAVPLADVAAAWREADSDARIVLTP